MNILILFCSCLSANAEDTTHIFFKKMNADKLIILKIPLKCRLYESKDSKKVGEIISYTDSTIWFEYKDYDTAAVNKIMDIDSLDRREKYDLIDTLVQNSSYRQEVRHESIYKIRVLSGNGTFGQEFALLGSALLFMGSSAALLFDLSTNVGGKFQWWNWIEVGGIVAGTSGVVILMKRDFYFSKWRPFVNKSD